MTLVSTFDKTLDQLAPALDPSTCTKRGLCLVKPQSGSSKGHNIYFEIHGSGPEKLVMIPGLGSSMGGARREIEWFTKRPDAYSILAVDNRGTGHSDTPKGPYTTVAMAEDTIAVLDHVGWTNDRELHIIGPSMGGMISLEMAYRIPKRIASLALIVTTAGGPMWKNFPSWKGLFSIASLMVLRDRDTRVSIVLETLFAKNWLDSPAEGDEQGRTNREVEMEAFKNGQPLPQQSFMAAMYHNWAPLSHSVSPSRLRTISSSIPKIVIVCGDQDRLVDSKNSFHLKDNMPEAEFMQWENTGHGINIQWPDRLRTLLERCIEEGRERSNASS